VVVIDHTNTQPAARHHFTTSTGTSFTGPAVSKSDWQYTNYSTHKYNAPSLFNRSDRRIRINDNFLLSPHWNTSDADDSYERSENPLKAK
jgi:hypothetical protein